MKKLIIVVGICMQQGFSVEASSPAVANEPVALLKCQITDARLVIEAEDNRSTLVSREEDRIYEQSSTIIWPLLKLSLNGSVYHPAFMSFDLHVEAGYSWEDASEETTEPVDDGSFSEDRDGTTALRRYDATVTFLRNKTYPVTLNAGRSVDRRDYDFFRRVTVYDDHYGLDMGSQNTVLPVTLSFQHTESETIDDFDQTSALDVDRAVLTAEHTRDNGDKTRFHMAADQYRRRELSYIEQNGESESLFLTDTHSFGPDDSATLRSRIDFDDRDSTYSDLTRLGVYESLILEHNDRLSSSYNYNFTDRRTEESDTVQHIASAGLKHQLYESLTSSIDLHGKSSENTYIDSYDLDVNQGGFKLSELYKKKLGKWGRLTVGAGFGVDNEQRDSTGDLLYEKDESYSMSDSRVHFLKQPGVDAESIVVKDSSGTRLYYEDVDYIVIEHGGVMELKRIFGGNIPAGSLVLVDYTAQLDPTDSFDSTLTDGMFRLDMMDRHFSFYGNFMSLHHSGGSTLFLEELDQGALGVHFNYQQFSAGYEYESVDSSYLPYQSSHSFQDYVFDLSPRSSIGLNFDQHAVKYDESGEEQTTYSFIGRFQAELRPGFQLLCEGGQRTASGLNLDRDLTTARAELDLAAGRLSVKVGYEYQREDYEGEQRDRDYIYMRARRSL
jgi:hypothetical protein